MYDSTQVTKHLLWLNMRKIIDSTEVIIQAYVRFNLVVHRPIFQKNIGFTSKITM